jgi:hypothetical protein
MIDNKKLSVIMLTRDSALTVREALKSIDRSVFDEVVVVDTGSTDNTIEIAEGCGADVWCYQWEEDFSGPLNFALSAATGDFVFRLDSDEVINPETYPVLEDLVRQPSASYLAHIFSTITRGNSQTSLESTMVRFFPRTTPIVYGGTIHENIAIQQMGVRDSGISITHYGYSDPEVERKKQYRNKVILERELEKNPEDPSLHHYMGITYHVLGQHRSAIKEFQTVLDLVREKIKDSRLLPDYVLATHNSLASSLLSLGMFQEALDVANGALKINEESAEAYLSKGFALLKMGRLNEAEFAARKALEYRDSKTVGVSDRTAGTWKAEALLHDIKHLRKADVLDDVLQSLRKSTALASCTNERGVIDGPIPVLAY